MTDDPFDLSRAEWIKCGVLILFVGAFVAILFSPRNDSDSESVASVSRLTPTELAVLVANPTRTAATISANTGFTAQRAELAPVLVEPTVRGAGAPEIQGSSSWSIETAVVPDTQWGDYCSGGCRDVTTSVSGCFSHEFAVVESNGMLVYYPPVSTDRPLTADYCFADVKDIGGFAENGTRGADVCWADKTLCVGPEGGWCLNPESCVPYDHANPFACYDVLAGCDDRNSWEVARDECVDTLRCDMSSLDECYGSIFCEDYEADSAFPGWDESETDDPWNTSEKSCNGWNCEQQEDDPFENKPEPWNSEPSTSYGDSNPWSDDSSTNNNDSNPWSTDDQKCTDWTNC